MSFNTRTIKGKKYVYFEYYEDGKKLQKYCGPEGGIRARRRALELELGHVEKHMDAERERVGEIRRELGLLPGE